MGTQKKEDRNIRKRRLLKRMNELLKCSTLTEKDAIMLGRKVNKNIAKRLLTVDHMKKRGMVLKTKKGLIWTFNPSKKLEKAEEEGF